MLSKYSFKLVLCLIIASDCFAQDTIYTRTDQRISCKVLEVTPTEVKFKKTELIDGPLFIENKSAIARIKYKNGFTDVFSETSLPTVITESNRNEGLTRKKKYPDLTSIAGERTFYLCDQRPIGENDLHDLLLSLNNPKLTEEVRRAKLSKKLSYVGFLAIPMGITGAICGVNAIGLGAWGFNNSRREYGTIAALLLSGASLSIGTTVYFDIKGRKANRRAIQVYRQTYLDQ